MSESILIQDMPKYFWIIKIFFPAADPARVIITFADKIYTRGQLSPDLWEHEKTHNRQQKFSKWYATYWWIKYIVSRRFRFSQELEAYRIQYKFALNNYSRNQAFEVLRRIAEELSGPLYNRLVSYERAEAMIRNDKNL